MFMMFWNLNAIRYNADMSRIHCLYASKMKEESLNKLHYVVTGIVYQNLNSWQNDLVFLDTAYQIPVDANY